MDLAHKYRMAFFGPAGEVLLEDLESQAEVRAGMLTPEQLAQMDEAKAAGKVPTLAPICPYAMARREGKAALYWHIRNMIDAASTNLTEEAQRGPDSPE